MTKDLYNYTLSYVTTKAKLQMNNILFIHEKYSIHYSNDYIIHKIT